MQGLTQSRGSRVYHIVTRTQHQPANALHFVAQGQAALLHATQRQFVDRRHLRRAVDQRIQIGVLHRQLDQASLG